MSTQQKIPIGITLPLRKGYSSYFEQSYDTLTQAKSNIVNLLNTRPGERRMQPTFGTRLWSLVFEQNTDIIEEKAKRIIEEDISTWVPEISVINTHITLLKRDETISDRDIYRLHIEVQFMVDATKQMDSVSLNVDSNV